MLFFTKCLTLLCFKQLVILKMIKKIADGKSMKNYPLCKNNNKKTSDEYVYIVSRKKRKLSVYPKTSLNILFQNE